MNTIRTITVAAIAAAAACAAAPADVVTDGVIYRAQNHPDGNQAAPLYGLRLDELYNATGSHDVFTFDFDHADSEVFVQAVGNTVKIWGHAVGGRDTGSDYAADQYRGVYGFAMQYQTGVGRATGDDDMIVTAPTASNYGWIDTPLGDRITLADQSNGDYTFRMGDEDLDGGHRGFAGISGWGWVNHGDDMTQHVYSSDFLFTVGSPVPAPGAGVLALMGCGVASIRRRRDAQAN